MSSYVSRACSREAWSAPMTFWALSALVAGACGSPQTPRAEYPPDPSAHAASPDREPIFELGSFASVQTAEIAEPVSDAPLALSTSEVGTRSPRAGCQPNRHAVEHSIRERLPAIRACYEHASRREPILGGKITVAFVIQADGQVRDAEAVENSTGSEIVAACVSNGVERIHFAPSPAGGPASCVYPFLFGVRR